MLAIATGDIKRWRFPYSANAQTRSWNAVRMRAGGDPRGDVITGGRWPAEPPDIVFELDQPHDPGDTISAGPDERPQWTRWARHLVTPVILLALAGVAIAVRGPAVAGNPVGQPSTAPVTTDPMSLVRPPSGPGLIAPPTGRPGQSITVVGFRDINLCGPSELRFDDGPVTHRVDATARPRAPELLAVFMVMVVPTTANPGPHRIQFWGPAHGGRRTVCGDVPVHQEELDAVDIEITP
jgi:hypothetical protein